MSSRPMFELRYLKQKFMEGVLAAMRDTSPDRQSRWSGMKDAMQIVSIDLERVRDPFRQRLEQIVESAKKLDSKNPPDIEGELLGLLMDVCAAKAIEDSEKTTA